MTVAVLTVTETDGPYPFLAALSGNARYRPIGRVSTVAGAVEAIERHAPDVVVAEVATVARATSWVDATITPTAAVLVVSCLPAEVALLPTMTAGVRGFVGAANAVEVIDYAIGRLATGEVYLDGDACRWLLELAGPRFLQRGESLLTLRQAQILELVKAGLSNSEIARLLGVSGETVKSHVHRAMRTLGVHDRREAAARTAR